MQSNTLCLKMKSVSHEVCHIRITADTDYEKAINLCKKIEHAGKEIVGAKLTFNYSNAVMVSHLRKDNPVTICVVSLKNLCDEVSASQYLSRIRNKLQEVTKKTSTTQVLSQLQTNSNVSVTSQTATSEGWIDHTRTFSDETTKGILSSLKNSQPDECIPDELFQQAFSRRMQM